VTDIKLQTNQKYNHDLYASAYTSINVKKTYQFKTQGKDDVTISDI